jgi:hypothetical protein
VKLNIQISTSGKTNEYTAKSGLYCAALLDKASETLLRDFCKSCDIEDLDKNLHCTIMYSPDKVISIKEAATFPRLTYKARVSNFTWWLGHDKEGYLVAELVCPALKHSHDVLIDVGAKSTFDEYKPHITVKHPLKFNADIFRKNTLDDLNDKLKKNPLVLQLVDVYIEDISQ